MVTLSTVLLLGLLALRRVGRRGRLARQAAAGVRPGQWRSVAAATEELHALIYPSKRVELEQRRIEKVLPEADDPSAPKQSGVDLDAGVVVLKHRSQP